MRASRVWIVGVIVAALMNALVGRWLDIRGWQPDVVLIALIYLGLTSGEIPPIIMGFIAGLYQDLYAPELLGHHALAKTCSGYLAGAFAGRIQVEQIPIQAAVILAIGLIHEALLAITGGGGVGGVVQSFLFKGVPVVLYSMLFAIIMITIFGSWLLPEDWGRAGVRKPRRVR